MAVPEPGARRGTGWLVEIPTAVASAPALAITTPPLTNTPATPAEPVPAIVSYSPEERDEWALAWRTAQLIKGPGITAAAAARSADRAR